MNRFVPAVVAAALLSAACTRQSLGWRPSVVADVPDSTHVRFTAYPGAPLTAGRALDWRRGTPRVVTGRGDTLLVPRGAALSVKLPGKTRHAGMGAIVGGAIGTAVSLAECHTPDRCEGASPYQLFGAAAGALIGVAIRTDHWIRIQWGLDANR